MVTSIFKIKLIVLFILICVLNAYSQYPTEVIITDLQNVQLKEKIQNNASKLLTEFNMAYYENRKPVLENNILTSNAINSILSLWETSIFRCYEQSIIEKCLMRTKGYEIRNIPLFFKEASEGENHEEGVIVFNSAGLIDDIFISVGINRVNEILNSAKDVTDFRRRQIVLDFVENFRTSYNKRDIQFLKDVFSEDALIITGNVIKVKPESGDFLTNSTLNNEIIQYTKQSKTEYIDKLRKIFKSNNYINIKFEEIKVAQHKKYPELYGVTVKQYWNTTNYSDIGYVFLMWDFKDEDKPIIHVRTWQPERFQGRNLTDTEIFNMGSFGKFNRK